MAFVDDFVGLLRLDDSFFGARLSLDEDFTTTMPVEVVEAEVGPLVGTLLPARVSAPRVKALPRRTC